MKKRMFILPIFLVAVVAVFLTMGESALGAQLDEAEVFIEWNSTDDDFGIQFFWDGEPWEEMSIKFEGEEVLEVETDGSVEDQGLTEGFFESAEPTTDELSMEEFLERFPEGEYKFKGEAKEGGRLRGKAEFTHTLPEPPENLSPAAGATNVPNTGFTASFTHNAVDTEGNPIEIEYYEVVVEKEEDDPILQTFKVILPPDVKEVDVPEQFLEPDTEYKLEVIAVEESGNKTITETDGDPFTTAP